MSDVWGDLEDAEAEVEMFSAQADEAVLRLVRLEALVPVCRKFRHVKTNGIYELLHEATNETDLTAIVVYRDFVSGKIWTRSAVDFFDGRFLEIK